MQSAANKIAEKRERLVTEIIQLSSSCPFADSSNPHYCPLHEVRKMSPEARCEFFALLNSEDLDYLRLYHEICLQVMTDGTLPGIPQPKTTLSQPSLAIEPTRPAQEIEIKSPGAPVLSSKPNRRVLKVVLPKPARGKAGRSKAVSPPVVSGVQALAV